MCSEHDTDWALSIKKMIHNHEKCMDDYLREKDKCYKIVDNNTHVENLYKKRIKSFQCVRKIYLFLNRTKPLYFSFRPKMLKFWRTVYRKRNEFIREINENLMIKAYNDKERNYLSLFKRTLEKYDPTYGFQIGLLLHVKFSKDIALVINGYLM